MTQTRTPFPIFARFLIALLLCLCGSLHAYAQAGSATADVPSLSATAPVAGQRFNSSYALGSGDVISINVFGEDDLSVEKVGLTDAGSIFYPVLGELQVQGMTVGDLERLITNGLKGRFLVNPRVAINVVEYRPFYIQGQVAKPGGYPYQPGLTIRKAASLAGGFRERAALNNIFLIREKDPTQTPQRSNLNTPLNPGDTVIVEESFF
jgi:polysaccharide biosynthesis/export protein VpsN